MKNKVIIVMLIAMLMTGCYNYHELNELFFVSTYGIDYNKETGKYKLVVQIYNMEKSTDGKSDTESSAGSVVVITGEGETLQNALKDMKSKTSKEMDTSYLANVVMSEEIAKNHLPNIVDFLVRTPEIRHSFNILISKNADLEKVLALVTPLSKTPTATIADTLKTSAENTGRTIETYYYEFLQDYLEEGRTPIIPVIDITHEQSDLANDMNTSKPAFNLSGIALFKDQKLGGFLENKATIGYNLVSGNIASLTIPIKCDENNYASVEITNFKAENKMSIINKQPEFRIALEIEATLSEVNCPLDLNEPQIINELNEKFKKEIKDYISETSNVAIKELHVDIFNFQNQLYKNYHSYWQKNKEKLTEDFVNIPISVKLNSKINRKGAGTSSVKGAS